MGKILDIESLVIVVLGSLAGIFLAFGLSALILNSGYGFPLFGLGLAFLIVLIILREILRRD